MLENVIQGLKTGKYQKISFLLGAGVSTNSGIPDFRSREGRYAKLNELKEKYNIEDPQFFFNIKFFKQNTMFFYDYMKGASFDKYKPSKTHYFIRLLQEKNLLNLVYTQNIDSLEERAGVEKNKIVYAHGNINEATCSNCRKQHNVEKLREYLKNGEILYCEMCSNPCKYSIVLFGEPLPNNYYANKNLLSESDLVFVIGTSLLVKPFAYLVNNFQQDTPRILINKENLMEKNEITRFLDYKESYINQVGDCDHVIESIVEQVGWKEDLYKLL
jgi:NAD+-dependent protein deacetylase SIR2